MISVCLATYNGGRFIKDQIDSILPQLGERDELIVSDDNSVDETVEIVHSIGDKRIQVLVSPGYKNPVKNFEYALNHCKGDKIFLSDQDDVWLPDKVAKFLGKLETADLVLSDFKIVDTDLNVLQESFFETHRSENGFIKNILRNSYVGSSIAFNRKILTAALPFPEEVPMHDWWIGLIAEAIGKVAVIDEPLLLYRRHTANASSTSAKSQYSFVQKIKMRISIILMLAKRLYLKK